MRPLTVALITAGIWLLFAGGLQIQEVGAALLVGSATGVGSAALGRMVGHRQSGLKLWLRHLPGIMFQAVSDCWTVTVVLTRLLRGQGQQGTFRRIPFEVGDDQPEAVGRRVLATIGTTLQPNTYVVGFNRERSEVLVHQLDLTSDEPIADDIRGAS